MKKLILFIAIFGSILNADELLGTPLRNLSFDLLNGENITLDELLTDGPILVDFWATWCAPCKKEMVYLDRFHKKYKENGFKILAVSTDSPRSISKVKSYVRTKKFTFMVGIDPNQQMAQKMNAILLPTSILINQKREIVWFHQGYIPGDEVEIELQIRQLLKLDQDPDE
ncbi:MAG: TlpA family protein disulfide reductase [Fidelibacterota bacterium]